MTPTNRRHQSLSRHEREQLALGDSASVDGVVPFEYVDGPNGVRGTEGATSFPAALVLAASFDRRLAAAYGAALADEVRAAGANTLLGPAMDILRVPQAGRSSESFGEDPLLNGELGGAIIAAARARGVLCIAKHFVANNFETGRTGTGSFTRRGDAVDVDLGDRELHEIYLAPFRRAVRRYGLLGLMTSYNRVRGQYVAQSPALLELPRRWGFRGVTVPDFLFAVRNPQAALAAGLDLPGLDAPAGRSRDSVSRLSDEALEQIAIHVLAAAESISTNQPDPAALATPQSLELAQQIAIAGTVLIQNDGLLPLAPADSIAVIDADRATELAVIGGSAAVVAPGHRCTDLVTELSRRSAEVESLGGTFATVRPAQQSADVTYRDLATGEEQVRHHTELRLDGAPGGIGPDWTADFEVQIVPETAGTYLLSLEFAGDARLSIDGRLAVSGSREASPMIVGPRYPLTAIAEFGDVPVHVRVSYSTGAAISVPGTRIAPHLELGWIRVDEAIARAADRASHTSAAVIVVGRPTGEAMDAESIRLPHDQELLITAVAARQARTIVAVLGSGPVVMPWRDDVAAIIHVGNAGERGMAALAAVLTGDAEPGGRLPFTVPIDERDIPLDADGYPGREGVARYAEGTEVGYRAYDARGIEPAFPFGHGLGYGQTHWTVMGITLLSDRIQAELVVANSSGRVAIAVPQLYSTSPSGTRALRAFESVSVPAGDDAAIVLDVPLDDLEEYHGSWTLPRGRHRFELARSSRDIVAAVDIVIP